MRFKGIPSSLGLPGITQNWSDPLRDTSAQLQEAERLHRQGKLDRAQAICEQLVDRYPDYVGALHTLGLIQAAKGNYPPALMCLIRAAMHDPQSWSTLGALSEVYLRLGADEMAAHTLEQARLIEPGNPSILTTLGEIYLQEREYELARDAFGQAFEFDHSLHPAATGLGVSYLQLGQYAEAVNVFEGLIKRGVRSLETLSGLSNLPSSVVHIDILAQLDKLAKSQSEDKAEFENSAGFIRAKALDKLGRHAEAWEHLVRANRTLFLLKQEEVRTLTDSQREDLVKLRQHPIKAKGSKSGTILLFIWGASRSGKTTMEKLVGALDGVKRGYENPIVRNAVRRTFQKSGLLTNSWFELLPRKLDSLCRDLYLKDLARRAGSAKVFTNTNPGRIVDASRIVGALPNTRLIFVKRNLEDTMLRIYMHKYSSRNAYAYDLNSIREHVTWYHEMIDVLAEKLPDITRVIRYEDMVADPAAALRVAADLCGLTMTEGPLPEIGDDRGCAEPYRQFMAAALEG